MPSSGTWGPAVTNVLYWPRQSSESYCCSSPWPGLVDEIMVTKIWIACWSSAQAQPFSLAAMKSGIFGICQPHWLLEGTSVLLPPLQRLLFTLSAFKELHCSFLACSLLEMDHLHCIALKISRPQQSESSPGNLLSYMAFNRNPWGGTV